MLFTSIEGHAHDANGTFLGFPVHMAFVQLDSGGIIRMTSVSIGFPVIVIEQLIMMLSVLRVIENSGVLEVSSVSCPR